MANCLKKNNLYKYLYNFVSDRKWEKNSKHFEFRLRGCVSISIFVARFVICKQKTKTSTSNLDLDLDSGFWIEIDI